MAEANEVNFQPGRPQLYTMPGITSVAEQFKDFLHIDDVASIVFNNRRGCPR
jgi:hypothetical protein